MRVVGSLLRNSDSANAFVTKFRELTDVQNLDSSQSNRVVLANGTGTGLIFGPLISDLGGNSGTVGSADRWTTARTLTLAGDGDGSVSFDGSADFTLNWVLDSVNSNIGTFGNSAGLKVPVPTVNAKGLVTGISEYALGSASAASTGTSGHSLGFLDGTNTWSGTQNFTSGLITTTGSFSEALSLGSSKVFTFGDATLTHTAAKTLTLAGYLSIEPQANLRLSNSNAGWRVSRYIDTNAAPAHQFVRARGTIASPAAVQNGDALLTLSAGAYDGSGLPTVGSINFNVAGPVSTGAVPTNLTMLVTNLAGASVLGLQIDPDQKVTLPGALLVGTGLSAATLSITAIDGSETQLDTTTTAGSLTLSRSNTSSGGAPALATRRSRGTLAAPLAVQQNDSLRQDLVYVYDGTSWLIPGRTRWQVAGPVSTGIIPTNMEVRTTSLAGVEATRFTFNSEGNFTAVGGLTGTTGTFSGNVGAAGLDTATSTMSVSTTQNLLGLQLTTTNDSGAGPRIVSRSSRGTIAAPTALVAGDYLNSFNVQGHNGTGWGLAGAMRFEVASAINNGIVPGNFFIQLTNLSGTLVKAMNLDHSGNLTLLGGLTATTGAFSGVLTSTVATGTAPLTVASTTLVPNLNVQYLNGLESSAFGQLGVANTWTATQTLRAGASGSFTTINGNSVVSSIYSDTSAPVWGFFKARGTELAPTPVVDGNTLGFFRWQAQSSVGVRTLARMSCVVNGTVDGTIIPTDVTFDLTDSAGSLATRFRFGSGGNLTASGQLISTVATGTAPLAVTSTTLVANLNAQYLGGLQSTAFGLLGSPNIWTGMQTFNGTAASGGINVDRYADDSTASQVLMRKARGTYAAPLAVQTGDALANFQGFGWNGANWVRGGNFRFVATGAVDSAVNSIQTRLDVILTSPEFGNRTAMSLSHAGFMSLADGFSATTGTFSGNLTAANLTGTNTGDQTTITGNAGTATRWQTSRALTLTGDASGSVSFDGSADASIAMTLATVNSNTGTFGSSTSYPVVTVNAKGLVTAASSVPLTPALYNRFVTSSAQTAFTLSLAVSSVSEIIVTRNGLRLDPTNDYTVSGTTLTIPSVVTNDIVIAERAGASTGNLRKDTISLYDTVAGAAKSSGYMAIMAETVRITAINGSVTYRLINLANDTVGSSTTITNKTSGTISIPANYFLKLEAATAPSSTNYGGVFAQVEQLS